MQKEEFERLLADKVDRFNERFQEYWPKPEGYQSKVMEAMCYALSGGGKRLRPLMMEEMYRIMGGTGKVIEPFMAAIEMIHTYSLVHDDLPAMDNDDYRRGRLTTHMVYGSGLGILAGDALLNYAFEVVLRRLTQYGGKDHENISRAIQIMAVSSGIYGMIGGQTADLEAEKMGDAITKEQLLFIHSHKTVALFKAALSIGAVLTGADEEALEAVDTCAHAFGLAFQIRDDILDVYGTMEELGKPIGSDAKNDKVTYVTLFGLKAAEDEVERLSGEAIGALKRLGREHEFLEQLILHLVNRRS
jgi:geranylgeranyl diphosphate synthase type II